MAYLNLAGAACDDIASRPGYSVRITRLLPGIALSCAVAGAACLAEGGERHWLGRSWLEPLVLAMLIGTAVRSLGCRDSRWQPGIAFGAKTILEVAVVLLGASVSAGAVLQAGPGLVIGIAAIVACAIPVSFAIGRLMGLPARMALLIACGNAICGNSAIATVAPVIDADAEDVGASIAFTAVLGVAVVLGLPLIGSALDMGTAAYGAFTGLTVYAVPQVLAAASPFGAAAVQLGTLVKLVRVLMLMPVCFVLSLAFRRSSAHGTEGGPLALTAQFVPWFIIGFMVLAACRSTGVLPAACLAPAETAASLLTVVSMAALGLSVDVRKLVGAGARVTATVVLSLGALGGLAAGLIAMLQLR